MVLRKLGNGNCCVLLLFALFIMCFLEVLIVILFVSLVLNLCGKLNSPVLLLNWLPTWNACCCCCCCCCYYISHSLFRLLGFGSFLSNVVLQSFIFFNLQNWPVVLVGKVTWIMRTRHALLDRTVTEWEILVEVFIYSIRWFFYKRT